jgi:hypothetical protein
MCRGIIRISGVGNEWKVEICQQYGNLLPNGSLEDNFVL